MKIKEFSLQKTKSKEIKCKIENIGDLILVRYDINVLGNNLSVL